MQTKAESVPTANGHSLSTPVEPAAPDQSTRKPKRVTKTLVEPVEGMFVKIHPSASKDKPIWQVLVSGKGKNRKFKTFYTEQAARLFARLRGLGQAHNQMAFIQIPPDQLRACCLMSELLAPFCQKLGIGLEPAIKEYLEAKALAPDQDLSVLVEDYLCQPWMTKGKTPIHLATEAYLAAKAARGCRPTTVFIQRRQLAALSGQVGELTALCDITGDQLNQFIYRPNYSPRSRILRYDCVHTFYDWLKRNGYLRYDTRNAMDAVARPKADHAAPAIMDVATAQSAIAALANLPAPELALILVLSLLAGVGPRDIDGVSLAQAATDKVIRIAGHPGSAQARTVPVSAALDAWLQPFYHQPGPLFRRKCLLAALSRTLKRHGIPWQQRWMSNTYAAYRYASTGKAPQTAQEAGKKLDVLVKYFHQLATPTEAAAFFALTPEACGITDWNERVHKWFGTDDTTGPKNI